MSDRRFPCWRRRDGTHIPIATMTDQHLINALKMLERRDARASVGIPFPEFQGDMAQYYAVHDWLDAAQSMDEHIEGHGPAHHSYLFLVREARRRDLEW